MRLKLEVFTFSSSSQYFANWGDIEQWNLMLSKRSISKCEHSQVQDLILRLKTESSVAQDPQLANLLSNHLGQYFADLHLHISSRNLCHLRSYEALADGLYVLLKGQVSYRFSSPEQARTPGKGNCSPTALLGEQWTVFECVFKNCATLEETYLLRVGEEQLALTNFSESFLRRKELYEMQYLSQDHRRLIKADDERPFRADLRIHSHFSFRSFHFRQTITLSSPAVLSQGRAKLKSSTLSSHQFDRFGVLLPGLRYEVTSSEAEIMVARQNETMVCHFEKIDLSYASDKVKLRSLFKTESQKPKCESKKELERRNRDLGRIAKQSEPYSILSAFLCEKNLSFAKRHNTQNRTRQKKEGRFRNPLILFSLSSLKSKLTVPAFEDLNATLQPHRSSISKNAHSQSAIFRKLKLPPADYDRFYNKQKPKTSHTLYCEPGKGNSRGIKLAFDRVSTDQNRDSEEEQFVPYNKA